MSSPSQPCDWRDAVGAYLLGAVSDVQARRFSAHLRDCRQCRADAEQLRPIVDALAAGVERIPPPPGLKRRIMADVEAQAELLRAAGAQADRVRRPRLEGRRRRVLSAAAALVAVIALVGAALWTARPDTAAPRVVAARVSGPMAAGARARLVVGAHAATLVVCGMPSPPTGHVYEVWLRRPSGTAPTHALFDVPSDGRASVAIGESLRGVRQVIVTAEPAGGSVRPTTAPVIVAPLA